MTSGEVKVGRVTRELLDILNGIVSGWEHYCVVGTGRPSVCGRLYRVLYKTVLKLEDKPIVSRFWLVC